MNAKQREPYRYLAKLVDRGLCNTCKFAEWDGSSCCELDLMCQHPLPVINGEDDGWQPYNVWLGGDCWGFRPSRSLAEWGAEVGIMLEGNMPYTNKRGELVAIIPTKPREVKV